LLQPHRGGQRARYNRHPAELDVRRELLGAQAVAAQVDPFENPNFETSLRCFLGCKG
jgi:hypothetical protein